LRKKRHWSRAMSEKCEKTDIGRGQCLKNAKKRTLVVANVPKLLKNGH
jgi:hypothetical protein